MLSKAWKAADKPVELHMYKKGGHGFGMKKQNLPIDEWPEQYVEWLTKLNMLKK